MAGRPPKPVLLKVLEGDTRKLGANKHAESVSSAVFARRGEPEMPKWTVPPLAKGATPEMQYEHAAARRRMKAAREHWEYLCRELGREGLLSTVDQGPLASACMIFALLNEAFVVCDVRAYSTLVARYMQIADRMGLNESARAKFQKPPNTIDDLEAALCG